MCPTQKQIALIEEIERYVNNVFDGKTRAEASQFITENMEEYKKEKESAFYQVFDFMF